MRRVTLAAGLVALLLAPPIFRFKGGTTSSVMESLVAYWKLDELTGTRTKTAGSCSSCDLTAVNAPAVVGGAGKYSMSTVKTSTQYVYSTDAAVKFGSGGAFTIAGWYTITTEAIQYVLTGYDGGANSSWDSYYTSNTVVVRGLTGGTARCQVTVSATIANRHLLTIRFDPAVGALGTMYASVDGGAESNTACTGSTIASGAGVSAGASINGTVPATGSFGPLMAWSRGLSPSDISEVYNSGLGRTCTGLSTSLRTNLVACWNLEEASGTRVESGIGSCGASCDLTAVNSPTRTVGFVGGALGLGAFSVSGSSQALSLADNADVSVGDEDFTVACWANPTVLGDKIILDKTNEYRLGIDAANKPYAKTGTTDTATWTGATTAGTWVFVAGGHDATGNTTWVSVNGAARVTTAETAAPADTANALRLFSTSAGGSYWDGAVDGCFLWKKNVPDATLSALYAAGVGVEYPWSLIAGLLTDTGQRWADLSIPVRQRIVYAKTGVAVPESMFPSREVSFR